MAFSTPELAALLQKTSAIGVSQRQSRSYLTPWDAVGFFADCLAACVLPRSMVVYLDNALCLELVANRGRLIEITDRSKDADLQLGPVSAADIDVFSQNFANLVSTRSNISVFFQPVTKGLDTQREGVTGAQILQASGYQFLRNLGANPFDILIEGAQNVLLGVYSPETGLTHRASGFELSSSLKDWIETIFGSIGVAGICEVTQVAFYSPSQSREITVGFSLGNGPPLAIVFSSGAVADVAEFWMGLQTNCDAVS
ncbi:MAG: hypothetical protein AAF393_00585 [Pseudomonadota bacterium]